MGVPMSIFDDPNSFQVSIGYFYKTSFLWVALTAFGMSCSGQNADHWQTYVKDQQTYRVVSPMATMVTYYTGLQMEASLLTNQALGYELAKVGFRIDAESGQANCIEFVYDLQPVFSDLVIPVEVIAFDIRYPNRRAWSVRDTVYLRRQENGLARGQIRTDQAAHDRIALVVKLDGAITTLSQKNALAAPTAFLDGPWDDQRWELSYFFYVVDRAYPPYQGQAEREAGIEQPVEDQN